MNKKEKVEYTDPSQISDEYIREIFETRLVGAYDYFLTKGIDIRKYAIHSWTQSTWVGSGYKEIGKTFDVDFSKLVKHLTDDKKMNLWVEITSGKYKGSVGIVGSFSWNGGIIVRLSDNGDSSTPLTVKALKLLPDHAGGYTKAVKARVIKDIFDQVIEPGSKVIFAERGKLHIGVMVEYDYHKNIAHVRTPTGKVPVNPRKSQIVNCEKINATFIENTVLIARLKSAT